MRTTFLFVASTGISPRSAFTLGYAVFTVLLNSLIDTEYLVTVVTVNRSMHFSHSIDGVIDASCLNSGNPTNNEFEVEELADADKVEARSTISDFLYRM